MHPVSYTHLEDALTNMVNRVDSNDLELAVTGVLIQRQVGGNLARVLDNIASTIDKRFKTRSRIRVATAQGRISAWVVTVPVSYTHLTFMTHSFPRWRLQMTY